MILYKTVAKEAHVEQEIRRSRFIAHIAPVADRTEAEAYLAAVKRQYKDATHNVPAMILGPGQEIQWASDDGEPQGTSGAPILQMLAKHELTNVIAVVTRYFGGTKLGTGGLIRAYTGSAALALEAAGMHRTEIESEAGLVIINTCAVRENAEDKVYGEIGKFKVNHQKDPSFVLCVCGCMMQETGVAEKLVKSYPYVNLIFGTHNLSNILSLLDERLARKKDLVDVLSYPGDIVENLPSIRLDAYKAFVNIGYGCDKFCTYCIVPYTRGRERSRAREDIIKECQELVEEGYQEITLLGQNVNSYGKDFHDGTSFATILEDVAKLGIPRLRFMTSHPWDFSDEMLDVIAKYDNIMPCIHLPVQSGSTTMLRRMGRRYTREQYLDLVRRIREKIPGCALTTDIIVGFPNET